MVIDYSEIRLISWFPYIASVSPWMSNLLGCWKYVSSPSKTYRLSSYTHDLKPPYQHLRMMSKTSWLSLTSFVSVRYSLEDVEFLVLHCLISSFLPRTSRLVCCFRSSKWSDKSLRDNVGAVHGDDDTKWVRSRRWCVLWKTWYTVHLVNPD